MKKYRVTIPIFASVTVEIKAESEEKAIENAYIPSLCHYCSSEGIELGEYDDSADIEVEEIE